MAYVALTTPSTGTAVLRSQIAQLIDNDADHEARIQLFLGAGLINGSFEVDGDGDGVPDGWEVDETGNGAVTLDDTTFYHGSQSLKITLGATNRYAFVESGESETVGEMVPTAQGERIELGVWANASVASIPLKAWIRWFDESASQVGADISLLDVASCATSWTRYAAQAVAPSGAYYYRIKLQGGHTTSAAGNVRLDGVVSRVYHGPVPIDIDSAVSLGTGATQTTHTVTVAAVGSEQPTKAAVGFQATAGIGDAPELTITGGDGTDVFRATYTTADGTAEIAYGNAAVSRIWVPLVANEFSYTVADDAFQAFVIKLYGYEV